MESIIPTNTSAKNNSPNNNNKNKNKIDNITNNIPLTTKLGSLSINKFNVEEIIEKCEVKEGLDLLNYMCEIMHEKKRNILETLYKNLGKDYLINQLEKALNIQNEGGLLKGHCTTGKDDDKQKLTNEKKTTGGIFFSIIKKDPEAKTILIRAAKLDWKESKQRKKVYKLFDKLSI